VLIVSAANNDTSSDDEAEVTSFLQTGQRMRMRAQSRQRKPYPQAGGAGGDKAAKWSRFFDKKSGRYYYADAVTKKTQWEVPVGFMEQAWSNDDGGDASTKPSGAKPIAAVEVAAVATPIAAVAQPVAAAVAQPVAAAVAQPAVGGAVSVEAYNALAQQMSQMQQMLNGGVSAAGQPVAAVVGQPMVQLATGAGVAAAQMPVVQQESAADRLAKAQQPIGAVATPVVAAAAVPAAVAQAQPAANLPAFMSQVGDAASLAETAAAVVEVPECTASLAMAGANSCYDFAVAIGLQGDHERVINTRNGLSCVDSAPTLSDMMKFPCTDDVLAEMKSEVAAKTPIQPAAVTGGTSLLQVQEQVSTTAAATAATAQQQPQLPGGDITLCQATMQDAGVSTCWDMAVAIGLSGNQHNVITNAGNGLACADSNPQPFDTLLFPCPNGV